MNLLYSFEAIIILSMEQRNRPNPDLNPNRAENLTHVLAVAVEDIARSASTLYDRGDHYSSQIVVSKHGLPSVLDMLGFSDAIPGIGAHTQAGKSYINLYYYEGEDYREEMREEYGIDTKGSSSLSVHTDELTLPQVEALLKSRKTTVEAIGTTYYFDEHGNRTKIIRLPKEVEDDRLIDHEDEYYKYIRCEVTDYDFELIKTAVAFFATHFDEAPKKTAHF